MSLNNEAFFTVTVRILVDIPTNKAEEIAKLIRRGKYNSFQDFIIAAVDNQTYLEENPNPVQSSSDETTRPTSRVAMPTGSSLLGSYTFPIVEEPQPDRLYLTKLWALHNRLFPVKLTVRVLANLLQETSMPEGYLSAETLYQAVTSEAVRFGKTLGKYEKQNKLASRVSVGLPNGTAEKSLERFRNSFVGNVVHRQGQSTELLDGAPGILRFVNFMRDKSGTLLVGLTRAGLSFAELRNPILDDQNYSTPLSIQEADYYLAHIESKVPAELEVCQVLLRAISEGKSTPNALTQVGDEDPAVKASQVSRLVELGLLERKRSGQRVSYELTPRGSILVRGIGTTAPRTGGR